MLRWGVHSAGALLCVVCAAHGVEQTEVGSRISSYSQAIRELLCTGGNINPRSALSTASLNRNHMFYLYMKGYKQGSLKTRSSHCGGRCQEHQRGLYSASLPAQCGRCCRGRRTPSGSVGRPQPRFPVPCPCREPRNFPSAVCVSGTYAKALPRALNLCHLVKEGPSPMSDGQRSPRCDFCRGVCAVRGPAEEPRRSPPSGARHNAARPEARSRAGGGCGTRRRAGLRAPSSASGAAPYGATGAAPQEPAPSVSRAARGALLPGLRSRHQSPPDGSLGSARAAHLSPAFRPLLTVTAPRAAANAGSSSAGSSSARMARAAPSARTERPLRPARAGRSSPAPAPRRHRP